MGFILKCSVSTALDEAATALTRMKSEKQTYEAFLRGANQAPSPLSVSLPNNQQLQPEPSYLPGASVAMATSISSGSGNGPGGDGAVVGGGGGKMPNQQKGVLPQQQQQQLQLQPQMQNQQPLDGMQTVQRLLSQGTKGKVHGTPLPRAESYFSAH